MLTQEIKETIVAPATPPGRGGIGIVRISGPKVSEIARNVLKKMLEPRLATFSNFYNTNNEIIDQGLALFFPAPNSFTGEDVLELHGHGGPIILDFLVKTIINHGARLARPGEFSERAFLNDKIDLTQAEAIADLIDASSEQAARSAIRSLQGEFSKQINELVEKLIHLRMYVEAAMDFPEEEIDFLSDGKIANELQNILVQIEKIIVTAKQGTLLRDGITVVIAGKPNAGKSSLLNQLSGKDVAIVTEIPGTTRDVLREQIQIDGLPIHIIDTAGLRISDDKVEREGIRRALTEINNADQLLLIMDSTQENEQEIFQYLTAHINPLPVNKITLIKNKIDLLNETAQIKHSGYTTILLSAKTGVGIDLLRQHLKSSTGYEATTEGNFISRRRHLAALNLAHEHLLQGQKQLSQYRAGELLAEELRQAQEILGEITGKFHSEDLLGKIFSTFCIGK